MKVKKIESFIDTEFIKLDQLLKYASIVQSGADAKFFISNNCVFVDEQIENRRGRKIYDSMKVKVLTEDCEFYIFVKKR